MDFADGFVILIVFAMLTYVVGSILHYVVKFTFIIVIGAIALVALPFVYGYTKFTERKKEAK